MLTTVPQTAAKADPERRKRVGNYTLGQSLGEGSFAKVRIGTHSISREKVAVKVVSKRHIIRHDVARRNFRREAFLLQHVSHPNIVRLYEAMETPNSYYLVLELAEKGHLLDYVIERKCLQEGESRHFMRQIASSVDHLHQSGIVHRNLKLENFLLNANSDIKLVDFGLSAMCQRESCLSTQCGSPVYAAPEIFANRRYGTPVDLWSLGVCLYAMVMGRLPFMPDSPTDLSQLHAFILKGIAIPTFLSPGLQRVLSGLLDLQESRRLTASDLLCQSWLTCSGSEPVARYPPVARAPPSAVDRNVVRYMTNTLRFSESDVIHSVTERKLNASSANYYLLKRHMDCQKNAKSSSSSSKVICSASTGDLCTSDSSGGSADCIASRPEPISTIQGTTEDEKGEMNNDKSQVAGDLRNPNYYKQFILYLKEVRGGFSLSGKTLNDLRPEIEEEVTSVSSKSLDSGSRKLPVVNGHSLSQQQGKHPSCSTSNPQCYDNVSHFLHPLVKKEIHLDVKGRPLLKKRNRGKVDREILDSGSHLTLNSSLQISTLPPPPTNSMKKARGSQKDHGDDSTSGPTADNSQFESSVKDPFGCEMWRALSKHDLSAAGVIESRRRRSGGMTFVAPLSSPKTLTCREEQGPCGKAGDLVITQLTAGMCRKHSNLANQKRSCSHQARKYSNSRDRKDTSRSTSASSTQSLTPVIRVTIRSTAKR